MKITRKQISNIIKESLDSSLNSMSNIAPIRAMQEYIQTHYDHRPSLDPNNFKNMVVWFRPGGGYNVQKVTVYFRNPVAYWDETYSKEVTFPMYANNWSYGSSGHGIDINPTKTTKISSVRRKSLLTVLEWEKELNALGIKTAWSPKEFKAAKRSIPRYSRQELDYWEKIIYGNLEE